MHETSSTLLKWFLVVLLSLVMPKYVSEIFKTCGLNASMYEDVNDIDLYCKRIFRIFNFDFIQEIKVSVYFLV